MFFVVHPQILHERCFKFNSWGHFNSQEKLKTINSYAKFGGGKQRVLWYVRVFSGVVNWTLPRIRAQIELSSTFVYDYKMSTSGSSAKNSHLTQGRRTTMIPMPVNLQPRARGGHSLIWRIRVCPAEQGLVFRVLSLKQGI